MSTELMYPLWEIKKSSGSGTLSYSDRVLTLTTQLWATDGNYIEITPTGNTFYYDIIFSNTSGNLLYLGFEKYDKDKTATSNNSCVYVISTSNASTDYHAKGTVNLATDSLGSPTKYIKLRVLNDWSTTASTHIASFSLISLRQAASITTPKIAKNGVITTDALREGDKAALYKNGFVEANNIIEN